MRREVGTGGTLDGAVGGPGAPRCGTVAPVLTEAEGERLTACARVLPALARVVMTGDVAPEALDAMRAGAGPAVEIVVLGTSETGGLEGSIDVLFVGPTAPYGAALEIFGHWPGRVVPGGTLFVHGAFASAPLTAALLRTVGASRGWRYFGREGALAEYVRADLSHGERALDAIAQAAQTAAFARRMARRRGRR
jgi:hypothetical protein